MSANESGTSAELFGYDHSRFDLATELTQMEIHDQHYDPAKHVDPMIAAEEDQGRLVLLDSGETWGYGQVSGLMV